MRCNRNTIVSTLGLLILTGLMTGCASVPKAVGSCPVLRPPPTAALDTLQAAGDGAIDAWVDDLDRHYQKLDACRRA